MCECCRWQAKNMARIAGFELRKKQEEEYVGKRHILPSGKKGEESPPSCGQTDPELLFQFLDEEEQQAALIRVFPFLLVRKI